ncbi:MTH938/NDUFAF3 family protein [Mesorhizobium sp. BR1-1-16]|uniref:Mth938-like domain-containing protein n=1 Tax=Mesorhizobium sp. BR1-1-16 TaxID=2876653 RepID=UPI001CCA3906|nr:MTH938/NDUFAF3 family protein [Mesorhizobium sp. BR1-1-16]MBZ9935461.1 MTH938/NDUFAF3 family protein [Mesorhizobium sp. BR1-1-16]
MALFKRPAPIVPRQQHLPQQVPIDAYGGEAGFRFAEMAHPGSILALPSGIYGWAPKSAAELDAETLAPVLDEASAIAVLVIGTGRDIAAISAPLRQALREASIGVEIMATGPAVRTYNILLAEGRSVAAALIAP